MELLNDVFSSLFFAHPTTSVVVKTNTDSIIVDPNGAKNKRRADHG